MADNTKQAPQMPQGSPILQFLADIVTKGSQPANGTAAAPQQPALGANGQAPSMGAAPQNPLAMLVHLMSIFGGKGGTNDAGQDPNAQPAPAPKSQQASKGGGGGEGSQSPLNVIKELVSIFGG